MLKYTVHIIFIWLGSLYFLYGQQNVSNIKEYEGEYVTYSFSDPNPIPVFGKIYPYYRYDGFTRSGEKKPWKIVELENDI